jgi:hypothetical protein
VKSGVRAAREVAQSLGALRAVQLTAHPQESVGAAIN